MQMRHALHCCVDMGGAAAQTRNITIGSVEPDALFPADAAYFQAQAQQAADSRVWGGIHLPIDTANGLTLGDAVASLVVKRGQADGCTEGLG